MSSKLLEAAGLMYVNGEMIPAEEATVSVLCHNIHYSGGVFDGERAYNGIIFKSHEHSERVLRSASLVEIPHSVTASGIEITAQGITITADEIDRIKQEVLEANGLENGYLRAFFYRDERIGVDPEGLGIHFGVASIPLENYWSEEMRKRGLILITSKRRRVPPNSIPQISKAAANYQVSQLAELEAHRKGADDALILDQDGYLAEGSVANLFLVRNGVLHTPKSDNDPEKGRFLPGITRQTVIDLARDLGIKVNDQKRIRPWKLRYLADEVFLTGSATEITPVRLVDTKGFDLEPTGSEVGFQVAGPITAQIAGAYADLVRSQPKTDPTPEPGPAP